MIALLILIAFIAVPIAEIVVLIEVGGVIGTWPTIALVVLTAVLGMGLIRWQGMAVLAEVRREIDRDAPPVAAAIDGLFLLIAGALLLTPGFLTDSVGFLCLVPPLRHWVARAALRRLLARGDLHVVGNPPRPSRPPPDVVEAEFIDVTETPDEDDEPKSRPRPDSPWSENGSASKDG